jgi:HPt (histidine-containing phosphotransfer) domain-containing protein
MTDNPRGKALVFLLVEHQLSRDEAEGALAVAEKVLRAELARLAEAVAADRPCREAAHALKGTLLNLGLPALAQQAQTLQDADRRGDTASRRNLVRKLHEALAPFFS